MVMLTGAGVVITTEMIGPVWLVPDCFTIRSELPSPRVLLSRSIFRFTIARRSFTESSKGSRPIRDVAERLTRRTH